MPGQTVRAKKRNEILEPTDPVLPHVVFCHMFRVGGPIREHFSQNFLVVSLFFVALLAIHLVDIMLCWCWAQCHPVLLLSFELCIHFFPDTVTPISQMDPVAYWPETWRGGMKMIPAKWLLRISFIECCLIQNTSKRQTLLKQTKLQSFPLHHTSFVWVTKLTRLPAKLAHFIHWLWHVGGKNKSFNAPHGKLAYASTVH